MVATHADWTGKGVGRALLDAIVELADNWLDLARLGLFVFTENAPPDPGAGVTLGPIDVRRHR